ncbi:unnamed protein product [Notodromas monacha]|uniref:Sugar phosphate transporter domain-containing protein n=1 Tax=Notodromas monacha TaxID=399045 RepID=A0A7R9GA96_9CRUS|nr:unnamed protein product [Notodromas monacha]CAG0915114.1 unnamed protein product [Notodromas monacha]
MEHTLYQRLGSAIFFALSSFLLVVVNKWILTSYAFPSLQCLALAQIMMTVMLLSGAKALRIVDYPPLGYETFRMMMPLPVIFVLNLLTGLGGTSRLSLPMFTVLRRFSILLTMLFEYVILKKVASPIIQFSVYVMIGGTMVAAMGDLSFDSWGYSFVLLNDLFTASQGVFTKQKLNSNYFGKYGVLYYNAFFTLIPTALYVYLSGEFDKALSFDGWENPLFFTLFLLSSVMGYTLMFATILCTQMNSPLTVTVVGCMKNIVTTYAGMFIGGDYIFSILNFIGLNIRVASRSSKAFPPFSSTAARVAATLEAVKAATTEKICRKGASSFDVAGSMLYSYVTFKPKNTPEKISPHRVIEKKPLLAEELTDLSETALLKKNFFNPDRNEEPKYGGKNSGATPDAFALHTDHNNRLEKGNHERFPYEINAGLYQRQMLDETAAHQHSISTQRGMDTLQEYTVFQKLGSAVFFAASSFLLVFVNKWILTSYSFPSMQCLAYSQAFLTVVVLGVAKIFRIVHFPNPHWKTYMKLMPLPLIYVVNVLAGLYGTKRLSLPMFTVMRRFTILITMLLELVLLKKIPSIPTQLAVYIIVAGAVVAGLGDLAYDGMGYLFVLVNDVFSAAQTVLMRKNLDGNHLNKNGLLFHNCFFSLMVMSYFVHYTGDLDLGMSYNGWSDPMFVLLFLTSSLMGYVLMLSAALCTEVNSPLTLMVTGCMKNIVTTYVGMFVGGDYKFSVLNFTGLNLSVAGSIVYSYVTFKPSRRSTPLLLETKVSNESNATGNS